MGIRYVFLGPPGAGKGTAAVRLAGFFEVPHISTGDMFREEMKEGTDLGKLAEECIGKGNLVPDRVTIEIVRRRLGRDDARRGFILDGFPRTVPQAEALGGILADLGAKLDGVVYFAAGREILVRRLAARRICRGCGAIYNLETMPPKRAGICDRCGGELYRRRDDMPRAVEERLREYEEKTADLAEYYRRLGVLIEIDAEVDKDETFDELKEMMSAAR